MLREEKRKQERFSFDRPPEGSLSLICEGVRLPIKGLNDISNAGVSLFVDAPLTVGKSLTVEYADTKVSVQVRGTVTWCAPARGPEESDAHVVGIELTSPMLLLSMFQKH